MTGDIIGGKQAVEMGLAGFFAEKTEDVLPKALEIADKLAAGHRLRLRRQGRGQRLFTAGRGRRDAD